MDRVYYTKDTNIVGVLAYSATKDNVREWPIPAGLFDVHGLCGPAGIACGRDGLVWIACESGNRLMGLDPRSGRYTAYFGGSATNTLIPGPRQLQFDDSDALWFTGSSNPTGAMIGRFDKTHGIVTTWTLPMDLMAPEGLAVEAAGNRIWCSPLHLGATRPGALFGCLDIVSGTMEMWRLANSRTYDLRCAGLAIDRIQNPTNVWITRDESGPGSRVYRYEIATRVCHEYATVKPSGPRRVVAVGRNAWVTGWMDQLIAVNGSANCGQVPVTSTIVKIAPTTHQASAKELASKAINWTSLPTKTTISPRQSECVAEFTIPGNQPIPNGLAVLSGPNNQHRFFFTESGLNQIGELQP